MKRISFLTRFFIVFTFVFLGCSQKKSDSKTQNNTLSTTISVPVFNQDSAYSYVAAQVAFGPRVPNTKAHFQCGDYLVLQLKRYGWEVTEQKFDAVAFDGKQLKARNIIASFNPSAQKRILLASHWDTRPFADQDQKDKEKPIDGANDGASGVGILIELARTIQNTSQKPTVGIDIIFFDVEDYGQPDYSTLPQKPDSWCLGSQYWAKNKHKPNYSAYYGILLDMVGAPNAVFAMEGTSMYYASDVVRKVWNTAAQVGYGNHFHQAVVDNIIDDHYYVNSLAKIPMIDIIEYNTSGEQFFGNYWHTHNDNMNVIDRNTLKAVGQVLLHVVYAE